MRADRAVISPAGGFFTQARPILIGAATTLVGVASTIAWNPTPSQLRVQLLFCVGAGLLGFLGAKAVEAPPAPWAADPTWAQRNRSVMLQRIKLSRVEDSADASTGIGWIEPVFRPRTDLVHAGERLAGRVPGAAELTGKPIVEIFDEMGQALLITGAPGSGKTTSLLNLTKELLKRAEADPSHPIPAVFNLSSWARARPPLKSWMRDQLAEVYDVPPIVGQVWIDAGGLLPLLDGLDEVAEEHRGACVQAINQFRKEHGLVPIAVCARSDDQALTNGGLKLLGAVEIQPLSRDQVVAHIRGAGDALSGVAEALASDPTLWELIESPLWLGMIALVCRNGPAGQVTAGDTLQERRERLFDAYVRAMLDREQMSGKFPDDKTLRWLSWLARSLKKHEQTEFYLENLQRSWLPSRSAQHTVTLLSALLTGSVAGLLYGTIVGLPPNPVGGMAAGLVAAALYGLGERSGPYRHFGKPRWSWPKLRRAALPSVACGVAAGQALVLPYGLLSGTPLRLAAGLTTGLVFGAVNGITTQGPGETPLIHARDRDSARLSLLIGAGVGLIMGIPAGLQSGMGSGLANGLQYGLSAALITAFLNALSTDRGDDAAAVEGRAKPARPSAQVGALVGLVIGVVTGLHTGIVVANDSGMLAGLFGGLSYGLAAGLFYGLLAGLFYELGRRSRVIRLGERLSWSWQAMRRGLRQSLGLGLVCGLLTGLSSVLILALEPRAGRVLLSEVTHGYAGAIVGVSFGLTVALISALVKGFASIRLDTPEPVPNKGTRRSARTAVVMGLSAGLALTVVAGLLAGWPTGLVYGALVGFMTGLFCGGMACFQHLLVRGLLVRAGAAPFQYVTFLDHAEDRHFLRKVGGGYSFIHRFLMEYFASSGSRPK